MTLRESLVLLFGHTTRTTERKPPASLLMGVASAPPLTAMHGADGPTLTTTITIIIIIIIIIIIVIVIKITIIDHNYYNYNHNYNPNLSKL